MDARARSEGTPSPATTSNHPTDLSLRLSCRSASEFLDRHAADVSRGGIFIRHGEVLPVGRTVKLLLQLADGATLLAGEGTVFWTREADPTRAESEPGMGIRFTRLTVESQRMLSFLLAEKAERERQDDGSSFDEDERTVVATEEELRAAAGSGDDNDPPPALPAASMGAVALALTAPLPSLPSLRSLASLAPLPALSPPAPPQPEALVIELSAPHHPRYNVEAARIAADAQPEPEAQPANLDLEMTDLTPRKRPRPSLRFSVGVVLTGAALLAACFALLARPPAPSRTASAAPAINSSVAMAVAAAERARVAPPVVVPATALSSAPSVLPPVFQTLTTTASAPLSK
jgi:uncharacterized protein (TIGR02266 family)